MKLAKYTFVVALLLVPFTAQLHGQTLAAMVAGSSALWTEAGQGAANNGTALQVNCSWTNTTSGVTFLTDARTGTGNPTENGNTWVVWTPAGGTCAAPGAGSLVYAYVNLDSTIGNRCFFANPACTFSTTATTSTIGANALPGDTDTTMPSGVISAISGASVSIAGTDILPADARFVTYRALANCGALSSGTQFQGLGYGTATTGVGQTILETTFGSIGTKSFHILDFNVFGNDPFTSNPVTAYTIVPVGAQPELVFVNNTDSSGFGSASVTNVSRATLALMYSSILVRTADVVPQTFAGLSASYTGVTAISREFLSGTYNVFEHSIPNNKELYRSQETGNCSGTNTVVSNPLNLSRTVADGGTSTTGNHYRAIGTGDMIKSAANTADSLGYAFWSAGNFATSTAYTVGNLKYLTVDGVDPLFSTYSNGTIPNAGNGLLPSVTLQNVANGSYPIWSEIRFVANAASLSAATQLATWAQSQVSFGAGATQPDMITAPNLAVFHMHFARSFINFNATNTPSNGPRVCGAGSNAEDGGDVGGLVMSLQAGADFCVLKSNYNAAGGVGPTNVSAAFGVIQ